MSTSSTRAWRVAATAMVAAVTIACGGGQAAFASETPTASLTAAEIAALVDAATPDGRAPQVVQPVAVAGQLTAAEGDRGSTVALPVDSSRPISLTAADGTAMRITLPVLSTAEDAVVSDSGTVVYSAAAGSDLAVQALDNGGVRAVVTIPDASAAKDYTFDIAVPAGVHPQLQEDGSVLYLDSAGNITGGLDAPWAKDAVGGTVATSYTINASAVTQHVAFTDDTAFPVVADPSGWWGWAKCTASVGAFVAGNLLAASKIAKLGGLAKVIKILKQARNAQERYKSLLYFFGEFAGINSILTNCK